MKAKMVYGKWPDFVSSLVAATRAR